MQTRPATIDSPAGGTADQVTREIINGKLLAIVDEMAIVLARASMSPVVYEVLDFACGICDGRGDLVAQTNGITIFTGTFSRQVHFIIERFGADMHPGDTFLTNDPFEGGTHACDFAIIRPIFAGGRLIAYAIAVAHLLDVGGAVAGSIPPDATSVYQEGLRLSGIRLTRDDRPIDDIIRIILENVRLPRLTMGDINAELAAVRIAERRIHETVAKYGADALDETFRLLLAASEARARVGDRRPPRRRVCRRRHRRRRWRERRPDSCPGRRSHPRVGNRGGLHRLQPGAECADQLQPRRAHLGGEDGDEGAGRAAGAVERRLVPPAHRHRAAGHDLHRREAVADRLVLRGCGASLRAGVEGACRRSCRQRFTAGSYVSLCATYISGSGNDGLFVHIEPQNGGWGATIDRDGASGMIAITDGDTYNYSIELLEAKFPLLIRRYDYNVKGGVGAGRYRGGFGLVREYEIESDDAVLYGSFGHTQTQPWGVDGGEAGSTNGIEVVRGGSSTRLTRTPHFPLRRGDLIRIITGGGGGWGRAADRAPEDVARDVRDGLIDADAARSALWRRRRSRAGDGR